MSKASQLGKKSTAHTVAVIQADPTDCPFREFKDSELSIDYWGLGPAALRVAQTFPKQSTKPTTSSQLAVWTDEQTQPLPSSVREYLHEWVRAEELALERWESEVVVFEDFKMTVVDMQLSHAQVLMRSSFCRKVMSCVYMLERAENVTVEHQSEQFSATFGTEGYRAKYHIYSPGQKPGGGPQHRPGLSKSGCYLVRLYHLGAWRCVWVSDQVPVDATGSPLLPFSPLLSRVAAKTKQPSTIVSDVVHLWPLLLCKALLKLAAPDMSKSQEEVDDVVIEVEDEEIHEFDCLHALTGCMSQKYYLTDSEVIWKLITSEVPVFSWDEDDEVQSSTVRSKTTKKMNTKDATTARQRSMLSVMINDTKDLPSYALPGISPGLAMSLIVTMVRDVPLKKPLPEPEIPLWKTYRWVDWARRHGLYDAYECPRTRFLKVNGLLKLSYAPHLLDVQSTESITFVFRVEHSKVDKPSKPPKAGKETDKNKVSQTFLQANALKDELREWVRFDSMKDLILYINVIYYPSHYEFTSGGSNPSVKIQKVPNRSVDIVAPKSAPFYFSVDGPDENCIKLSLSVLHPRILMNCGVLIDEDFEKSYVLLEVFNWFVDTELPLPKAYTMTRGYDALEVCFRPGRHYCRIWVHSRTNWHIAVLSDSAILLGGLDTIMASAVRECPWVFKFLNYLGSAFNSWMKVSKSTTSVLANDREFYSSYQPDLEWDPKVVGYSKHMLHWMFRQTLQSLLEKKLIAPELELVCPFLRKQFSDPDFGFPPKPDPPANYREIIGADPCDCTIPVPEEGAEEEHEEKATEEEKMETIPSIQLVHPKIVEELLKPTDGPGICDFASTDIGCGLIRKEIMKLVRKHEAATVLQAHWRGQWARKCLTRHVPLTPEILKLLNECAFGTQEALSSLMNEFFLKYPGAKDAYSISSGLSGAYGFQQYTGNTLVTPKCSWIPFFQGVFYCHAPVKVHFHIHSVIRQCLTLVYNNDTGEALRSAYTAFNTYEFEPNMYGYTVMGQGQQLSRMSTYLEAHWQFTVLTSLDHVFHICDNGEPPECQISNLPGASKMRIEEFYVPNRRNILGGIQISVSKIEAVSFRAATTESDLEIEAILISTNKDGVKEELGRCKGKGKICWPYIRLKPHDSINSSNSILSKKSVSTNFLPHKSSQHGLHSPKNKRRLTMAGAANYKSKSTSRLKGDDKKQAPLEPKMYSIQVVASNGWALPLAQWKRVHEVRNMIAPPKLEAPSSKKAKITSSAKDKKEKAAAAVKEEQSFVAYQPLPDDPYTELEISTIVGGGTFPRRDDERDREFALARRHWEMKQPGRNVLGQKIRTNFREEFLVPTILPKTPSSAREVGQEDFVFGEEHVHEATASILSLRPPTLASITQVEVEAEEEALYFTMPEQLRDKFIPLYFLPLVTKELTENRIKFTDEMAEEAKNIRDRLLEESLKRMQELKEFNEDHVLGRQKNRCKLLENLLIDGQWNPELATAMADRDEAVAREIQTIALVSKNAQQKQKIDSAASKKKK